MDIIQELPWSLNPGTTETISFTLCEKSVLSKNSLIAEKQLCLPSDIPKAKIKGKQRLVKEYQLSPSVRIF